MLNDRLSYNVISIHCGVGLQRRMGPAFEPWVLNWTEVRVTYVYTPKLPNSEDPLIS